MPCRCFDVLSKVKVMDNLKGEHRGQRNLAVKVKLEVGILPRLSSMQARRVSAPITSPQAGWCLIKDRVQNKLLAEIDPSMDVSRTDDRTIQGLFEQILTEENIVLSGLSGLDS